MTRKEQEVIKRLEKMVYVCEHNPNATPPYLIRLIGVRRAMIDKLSPDQTSDILGRGNTLAQAGENALRDREMFLHYMTNASCPVCEQEHQHQSLQFCPRPQDPHFSQHDFSCAKCNNLFVVHKKQDGTFTLFWYGFNWDGDVLRSVDRCPPCVPMSKTP